MARKLNTDMVLLGVTLALLGFGLVMVWSASSALAQERHDSPYYFLVKQIAWGSIGLVGMVLALRLDYKTLRRPAFIYPLLIVSTLLLIVVLFLPAVNGTHRWIRLGALSFQPAELAKIAIVVFLAYHIERRAERINELVTLFPALLLLSWFGFLVLIQQDLGSAFCLVLTGCVMLFAAGVRLKYFAALAVPALVVLYAAVMAVPWRRMRITSFINPWADPQGAGYHVIQSLIAVGTGGVTGVGLMEGRQKLFYLPYPYSDFVFAVIELHLLRRLEPAVRGAALARPSGVVERARRVWPLPGRGPDAVDRAAGAHQHLRCAGAAASQGDPAAVHQRGRLLTRVRALRRRPGGQRVAARGLTWRARS